MDGSLTRHVFFTCTWTKESKAKFQQYLEKGLISGISLILAGRTKK